MAIQVHKELQERSFLGLFDRPATSGVDRRFLRECFNADLRGGVLSRRGGKRRINNTALSGTQHGVFYAKFNNGTNERIVAHGTAVSVVTKEPSAITNSLPSDDNTISGGKTYFAQLADLVFMSNATDLDMKYNGTALQKWGIEKPGSAPSGSSASGSVSSTRRYRITFYNSATLHEGPPSDATSDVVLSSQDRTVTSPSSPTDGQVDQWRAYAAIVVADRPGIYFRVGTANLASNITDSRTDAVLKVQNVLEEFLNEPPAGPFSLIATHQGRILAVPDADKSLLYISDHGGFYSKPESFPVLNFLPISYRDGDDLTAIVSMDEFVLLFKRYSIWAMVGNWPDIQLRAISFRPDRTSIGTIDQNAVVAFEQEIIFPSHDGVYRLAKGELASEGLFKSNKISDVIDNFYDKVDQSSAIHASYDRSRRQYRLWLTMRTGQSVSAVRVQA